MTASRLVLMVTLTIGLLAAPLAVKAQPAAKISRIGYLATGSAPAGANPFIDAFKQGLRGAAAGD